MIDSTRNMRALEALADEAAADELEAGTPTHESRAAAGRYGAVVADRLAAMRRADLARVPIATQRRPIRRSLLGMGRDALLAVLAQLEAASPGLAFAHRELRHVSDDDLRTMIDDAEWAMEQAPRDAT